MQALCLDDRMQARACSRALHCLTYVRNSVLALLPFVSTCSSCLHIVKCLQPTCPASMPRHHLFQNMCSATKAGKSLGNYRHAGVFSGCAGNALVPATELTIPPVAQEEVQPKQAGRQQQLLAAVCLLQHQPQRDLQQIEAGTSSSGSATKFHQQHTPRQCTLAWYTRAAGLIMACAHQADIDRITAVDLELLVAAHPAKYRRSTANTCQLAGCLLLA